MIFIFILSLSSFFSKVKGAFHFSIDVKDSAATEKILEIQQEINTIKNIGEENYSDEDKEKLKILETRLVDKF